MRSSVLEGDAFDGKDVYPIVRRELMRWGGEVMALPLGIELAVPEMQIKSHPGLNFLAIAALNAVSNGREGVLFDPQTMKPRITDAVFVNALQQLAKADPAGKPSESRDVHIVPVLGFADRLMAVTSSSRNGASAFKLAAWLASPETSTQLASAGERMLPVRRSLAAVAAWHDPAQSAGERTETAKTLEAALNAERCLLVPRIPGVDEYMAALDEAARTPAADKVTAEAVLQKVAERWEQITNAHGREAQRRAYLKHLQISE
jgi:ABC-type glycerol-3-phosphate transport system substrate-binding protein